MMNIVRQTSLRPQLPTIYGPKDYREMRERLECMDHILNSSDLEERFIGEFLQRRGITDPRPKLIDMLVKSLRCNILKTLTGLCFRELATRFADSQLYQWFAGYGPYGAIGFYRTPSKSTLERFSKLFDVSDIEILNNHLLAQAFDPVQASKVLGFDTPLNCNEIYADSTCIKANIHFPVDWVLLRDAVRTLTKAIVCIRRQGLKHRMPTPESFLTTINGLSMAMAGARRKKDAKKQRKTIVRRMKKLVHIVENHGKQYYELLDENWQSTSWSRKQTEVVLNRIENILNQLPQAIHQAHERLIGERRVSSNDKILSLYEHEMHILVRGKSDSEVEFGNGLYLAEQKDGLIVDWQFFEDHPPSDHQIVSASIKRISSHLGKIRSYTADRGFWHKDTVSFLEEEKIINGIFPRGQIAARSELHSRFDKRRAQTEGRIGIFKNVILGNPLKAKGFAHRHKAIAMAVLTHNLWFLARCSAAKARERSDQKISRAA